MSLSSKPLLGDHSCNGLIYYTSYNDEQVSVDLC